MLINKGIDVYIINHGCIRLVDIAGKKGYTKIVELLKKQGVRYLIKIDSLTPMILNPQPVQKVYRHGGCICHKMHYKRVPFVKS